MGFFECLGRYIDIDEFADLIRKLSSGAASSGAGSGTAVSRGSTLDRMDTG